jgi:hypothetical protein
MTMTCVPRAVWGDPALERIWILPFTQLQEDSSLEYLEEALPALLTVAFSASGESHSIVERQHLNAVLAEQSLALEDLTSNETRQQIGKLLGATVMITGSFARQDAHVLLVMRASDLETGVVIATAGGKSPVGQPAELVSTLYRQLATNLDRQLPVLAADQIDEAPLSNLHFMKGLGHYHAGRYTHALAEFMIATEDGKSTAISRFWMANAYLAQAQYAHAYLELSRLADGASRNVRSGEIAARLRECEQHLSTEEMQVIRQLAVSRK